MKHKRLKLPLPPGFFRCPQLPDIDRLTYIRHGKKALLDFVQMCRLQGGSIRWTFDHETNGVVVYRGIDTNKAVVYLRVTEICGTLPEVANLMSVGDDGNQDYCATYHNDHIIDYQTLYTLATPTSQHPHNSIVLKWRAMETKFMATRDFCVIESQDDFTLDGIPGFARCIQSIDIPALCPDLEKSFGLIRGQIHYGGEVFLQSRRAGYITACRLYQTDMSNIALPKWCIGMFSKAQLTRDVQAIDTHLRQQRINHSAFLPEYTLVPRHTRSYCASCRGKFSPISSKNNCRKCGEVVCKKCHRPWEVATRELLLAKKQVYRVCDTCSSTPLPCSLIMVHASETSSDNSWIVDHPVKGGQYADCDEPPIIKLSFYGTNNSFADSFYHQSLADCSGLCDDIPIMMSSKGSISGDILDYLQICNYDCIKTFRLSVSVREDDENGSTSATADAEDWS